jgi:ABC-2 type transport system permease protein
MFSLAFIFTAFGTALASKVEDMQAFPLIMNFIIMPVFFLSGAIFPLESASKGIKTIALFDPLSYQIDALRQILTGASHFGLGIDFSVTIICAVLVTILGIYLFNRVEV